VDVTGLSFLDPAMEDLAKYCEEWDSWKGPVVGLQHSGRIDGFEPYWEHGAFELGHHAPSWI